MFRIPSHTCCSSLVMLALSPSVSSNHFPKHLIGFPIIDGILSPWTESWNRYVTLPFCMIRDLDFLGLKVILAHNAASSSARSIHLAWMCVSVVMVRSPIKPLVGGCLILLAVLGPLVSLSPALMIMFMPMTKRITEIVHPVTMPFCSFCHVVVKLLVVNRRWIPL